MKYKVMQKQEKRSFFHEYKVSCWICIFLAGFSSKGATFWYKTLVSILMLSKSISLETSLCGYNLETRPKLTSHVFLKLINFIVPFISYAPKATAKMLL